MEIGSYNQRSESSPTCDLNSAIMTDTKKTPLRRSKDTERSSPFLNYDDFKEYRRRC